MGTKPQSTRGRKTMRDLLPAWMFPSMPEKPERIDPGPGGEPPADHSVVVECAGQLFNRITLYRPHWYSLNVPEEAGPILAAFFHEWWQHSGAYTDDKPENREVRTLIQGLAASTAGSARGAGLERRCAWRIVDWQIRAEAPPVLELAGFSGHAARFRALPPIAGPKLSPETVRAFRAACRDTEKASSDAVWGRGAYRGGKDLGRDLTLGPFGRTIIGPSVPVHLLEIAACDVVPALRKSTDRLEPLALGLESEGQAQCCITHDKRISNADVERLRGELREAGLAFIRELIAMGQMAKAVAA